MSAPSNSTPAKVGRFSVPLPRPLWIGLATLALIVAALGWRVGWPIYKERAAIQRLDRLGHIVEMDRRRANWLRGWLGDDLMAPFDRVARIEFVFPVSDSELEALKGLPELPVLIASGTALTDDGMAHLKTLHALRELTLDESRITDAGLQHLSG